MEEDKWAVRNDLAVERAAAKAAEVERMVDLMKGSAEVEIRELAKLLASKSNRELLGATDSLVRDGVHRIGVRLLKAAQRTTPLVVPVARDLSHLALNRDRR